MRRLLSRWRLARTWRVYAVGDDGMVLRRGHWWRHEYLHASTGLPGAPCFRVGDYVDIL